MCSRSLCPLISYTISHIVQPVFIYISQSVRKHIRNTTVYSLTDACLHQCFRHPEAMLGVLEHATPCLCFHFCLLGDGRAGGEKRAHPTHTTKEQFKPQPSSRVLEVKHILTEFQSGWFIFSTVLFILLQPFMVFHRFIE